MTGVLKKAKWLLPIAVVAIIWYADFYFESRQNLLVTFFDIGQGDAVFIEVPGGNQVLIDGGPSERILSKLGRAMPFWDRSLDLLILTHPHADHLDGLFEVLKKYEVGMVLESGANHSLAEYKEWQEMLIKKNIHTVYARAGQKIVLGGGAELDVYYPFRNFTGESLKNQHDANVVARLKYGKNSVLLTGDAEKSAEYRLLWEAPKNPFFVLRSDVLKVGHHGSKTSSSGDFLKTVSPRWAVISVGDKNRYGHPHQEVLDRLSAVVSKIFRTDIDGDIKIESDGKNLVLAPR